MYVVEQLLGQKMTGQQSWLVCPTKKKHMSHAGIKLWDHSSLHQNQWVCITAAYAVLCTTPTHRALVHGIVNSSNQKNLCPSYRSLYHHLGPPHYGPPCVSASSALFQHFLTFQSKAAHDFIQNGSRVEPVVQSMPMLHFSSRSWSQLPVRKQTQGIFWCASNRRKNFSAHGGTSLWAAPDCLAEWFRSYLSLVWIDANEKYNAKTNSEIRLNIPRGPSDWKRASMFSWNQFVLLLWPKVPIDPVGWAPASWMIAIRPAVWLADRIPVLPLVVWTNGPIGICLRGELWTWSSVEDEHILLVLLEGSGGCCGSSGGCCGGYWRCTGMENISTTDLVSDNISASAMTSRLSILLNKKNRIRKRVSPNNNTNQIKERY